jgi:hypothetical protein
VLCCLHCFTFWLLMASLAFTVQKLSSFQIIRLFLAYILIYQNIYAAFFGFATIMQSSHSSVYFQIFTTSSPAFSKSSYH